MAEQVAVTKVIEIDVKASANANEHLKALAESTKGIEEKAGKAGGALQQMVGMFKGFIGYQIFDMIGGSLMGMASALQEVSDKAKLLEERMKLVTGSTEEATKAFQTVIDISIRQGRELDGVAKLYERVQRNSDNLALSQKGVALITEGVAASLRLSGAGTQEANAAMLQFSQALASGKLGGDEFRSLMENNSVLMQEFAKSLGTTMGGLREMSKDGKLNAETLREAMLKLGADGKNMLQRLIEQADKLPKTFDQAVAGSKTAFVDLTNALQQLGDKSEGIFTKIIKGLTAAMREAAVRLRDYALINEEVAKRLGKELTPKEEELSFEKRYMRENVQRAALIDQQIKRAEQLYEVTKKANQAGAGAWDQWEKSLNATRMRENIERLKGEASAVATIISRLSEAEEAAAKTDVSQYVTGSVKTGTTEEKKPKGPKKTTAEEVIARIRADIEGETVRLTALMDGETKARSALEEKLLDIEKALPAGMSQKAKDEFKEWARQRVAANDAMLKELDKRKQDAADSAERLEQFNKDVESLNKKHLDAIERIRQSMGKRAEKENPFSGIEFEVEQMKKLMWDPATSDSDAQMIADAIQERMHTAGLKIAKDLLGEKEPLLSIGDQMAKSFSSAFDRMETDLLDFSKSAKDIALDLVESLLRDFARLQLQKQLEPLMEMGTKFLKDFDWGSIFGSANGSAYEYGVRKFGAGGIVDQPTPFSYNGGQRGVAGEAGTEAIMPLKRGTDGKLGVGATPVTVNIFNNAPNTKTRQEETTNSNGERQINIIIDQAVEAGLGSGRFDNVLNKSFALSRRGS